MRIFEGLKFGDIVFSGCEEYKQYKFVTYIDDGHIFVSSGNFNGVLRTDCCFILKEGELIKVTDLPVNNEKPCLSNRPIKPFKSNIKGANVIKQPQFSYKYNADEGYEFLVDGEPTIKLLREPKDENIKDVFNDFINIYNEGINFALKQLINGFSVTDITNEQYTKSEVIDDVEFIEKNINEMCGSDEKKRESLTRVLEYAKRKYRRYRRD